jgi:hypothetical protein
MKTSTLKHIRGVIFIDELEVEMMTKYQQQNRQTVKELLSCSIHMRMRMIHATFILHKLKEKERWMKVRLWSQKYLMPIKVRKVNIGTSGNPKMESIRDYWDEQTVEIIT